MGELRADMLPDKQPEEVTEVAIDPTPEPEVPDEPLEQEQPKPPKGYVPKEALQEERRLRKQAEVEAAEAEARLNSLSSSEPDEDTVEVEDTSSLEARLARMEKAELYRNNPELSDKREEFEEFLQEHPEYPLESAAKVFKAENGLYETQKSRKGLERPTSGPKTPPQSGFTPEQIKDLRENQPRKYIELLRAGKIKF